jgi:hypothetical protein
MRDNITIKAVRTSALDERIVKSFGGLASTNDKGALPIRGVGISCVGMPGIQIKPLADHGYYAWDPHTDPRRYALRDLADEQRDMAAITGAEVLNDKALLMRLVVMRHSINAIRNRNQTIRRPDTQANFEFIQLPKCSILVHTNADLSGEFVAYDRKEEGFEEFIRGLIAVSFLDDEKSGHEALRETQFIQQVLFDHMWDTNNLQGSDVYKRLRDITINVLPPKDF